jgi:ADP-ribose pyrophosphatase
VPLPKLPDTRIVVVADRTHEVGPLGGFSNVQRLLLQTETEGGIRSEPFAYDVVQRRALDAAVIVAYAKGPAGPEVYLRSSLRPPLALRNIAPAHTGVVWELAAGLIEPGEDPQHAAARELHEELGFRVAPESLQRLGPAMAPAPALVGELLHFYIVEVDSGAQERPPEDGSVLERDAAIAKVPLSEALRMCSRGETCDQKTELGLRRAQEHLAQQGAQR